MIYIVYREEQGSISGYDISGVFLDYNSARYWAMSEGNGQSIMEQAPGPIDWKKMDEESRKTRKYWE